MSEINTGGPAFPAGSVRKSRPLQDPGGNFVVTDSMEPVNKGMTLRDYFAAKAMQAGIAGSAARNEPFIYGEMAALAYEMADAMLKARNA